MVGGRQSGSTPRSRSIASRLRARDEYCSASALRGGGLCECGIGSQNVFLFAVAWIRLPPKFPRSSRMPECFVAKASDLKDGDRRIVTSGKHEVGVFFKDGAYYAYSNYCVHA